MGYKYIDKYKKNGKWIYVYPGESASKNVFGRVRGGTGGSLQAHQRLNREATNQVLANSPSRNIPSAQTSGGTQMTKKQVRKAKMYGAKAKMDKYVDGVAKNVEAGASKAAKRVSDTVGEYTSKVKSNAVKRKLTQPIRENKKRLRKNLRQTKVKNLKNSASKSINRAKSWVNGLFD